VEADHLDYYKTWDAVKDAFRQFVSQVREGGVLFLCADNAEAMALRTHAATGVEVVTYALDSKADWRAEIHEGAAQSVGEAFRPPAHASSLRQSFRVTKNGVPYGDFNIALPIRHNVQNALGAIAVCSTLGLSADEIGAALVRYTGVRRRFELIGEANDILVYDDYAHHPTEIADTAAAAKESFPGRRIVALFQPHTYARTRYLLDGFRTCFRDFDRLFILETYAAREAIADGMTAKQLTTEIADLSPTYAATFDEAAEALAAELRPGDVFFTIGAGDVDSVGPKVLERLRAREAAHG
jgi:UDP-N-acetylmuramate--alanine ligase